MRMVLKLVTATANACNDFWRMLACVSDTTVSDDLASFHDAYNNYFFDDNRSIEMCRKLVLEKL